MKVSGRWLADPTSQAVCAMLTDAGHQAYFVGGCVRNALLGEPVADLDISTDARPDKVMELARDAGFKALPTGIDHGTITVIHDGTPHEITTFRKDIETDGRRAVVAFADSIHDDAHRRDFTMNALYAHPSGTLLDPVGGLPDLEARRVRFIDDANLRIREDHLRSLRFFRFNAWYGDPKGGYDREALAAIADNLDGLDTLSRERIGHEVVKLLSAPDPVSAVAVMHRCGVLTRILPGADDTALGPLVYLEDEAGFVADPILRLAALGGIDVPERLRLSRAGARKLTLLREQAAAGAGAGELGYRFGAECAEQVLTLRAALNEEHLDPEHFAAAEAGGAATFPVSADDLMPAFSGPALGERLRTLENRWISSGFELGRAELLAEN